MRSVICAKKGPRAERAALRTCEWSLPTAGACPFDVVDVLVCDLFCLQESKSNTFRQAPPAGAAQRCRHKQSQAFCEPSGTTARVRAWRSFLPVPGLQAGVQDAGPLHCNSTHKHAPPCCKQPRKSTMSFAHLRKWPRRPRAASSRVRSGWRGQSHSKRKGVVKIIEKANSGTKRRG